MSRAPRLFAAALFAASLAAHAASAESVQQATAEAIRRLDLQLDLPMAPPSLNWNIPLPSWLFWGMVIFAALLLLYFFVRDVLPTFLTGRRAGWSEDPAAAPADGGPRPDPALIAADALAGDGRFVEAMHALLLQSLAEIRRRRGAAMADSLTSREILRRVPLSESARVPLRDIVASVERSYFGKYPVEAADYAACRLSFDRFAAAFAAEAAS